MLSTHGLEMFRTIDAGIRSSAWMIKFVRVDDVSYKSIDWPSYMRSGNSLYLSRASKNTNCTNSFIGFYERAQSLLQAVRFTYVFAPISTHERNVNTIGRLQDNIRPPARELSATAVLNTGELLQNPDNSVPHLGQSKLLTNANPRASIERNVGP